MSTQTGEVQLAAAEVPGDLAAARAPAVQGGDVALALVERLDRCADKLADFALALAFEHLDVGPGNRTQALEERPVRVDEHLAAAVGSAEQLADPVQGAGQQPFVDLALARAVTLVRGGGALADLLEGVLDELARGAADGGYLGAELLPLPVAQQPVEQLLCALAAVWCCAVTSHYL